MSVMPHHVAPVFHVASIEIALRYYVDVLGFDERFRFGDSYAGVGIGSVDIHLAQGGGTYQRPLGGSSIYVFLDSAAGVDSCCAEIAGRGARVVSEPRDYPYGMRDFTVFDPDGNVLTYGAEVEPE